MILILFSRIFILRPLFMHKLSFETVANGSHQLDNQKIHLNIQIVLLRHLIHLFHHFFFFHSHTLDQLNLVAKLVDIFFWLSCLISHLKFIFSCLIPSILNMSHIWWSANVHCKHPIMDFNPGGVRYSVYSGIYLSSQSLQWLHTIVLVYVSV